MEPMLIAAVVVLVSFFIFVFLFSRKISDGASKPEEPAIEARPPVARRIVSGAGARRRQRRLQANEETAEDAEDNPSDGELMGEKDELAALRESGKIGAKKLRKLEEKAEKRAQREAAEIERQERKVREEMREEERKRQESKKQKEEAEQAAREEQIRLEKKRQEEEEYQRFKESFTIEEEGKDALEEEEEQNLLQDFIAHIKTNKVVMLEDVAAKFHIKTQEVINRVMTLQEEGVLTGVMDDRGKFIYITQEEYEAVAKFIKQRGRVSIAELSESMNQIICLDDNKQILVQSH